MPRLCVVRDRPQVPEAVPDDWPDNILVLWEEDDAGTPDRERPEDALNRITDGQFLRKRCRELRRSDMGDQIIYLYEEGLVMCVSPMGGWVGMLVKTEIV